MYYFFQKVYISAETCSRIRMLSHLGQKSGVAHRPFPSLSLSLSPAHAQESGVSGARVCAYTGRRKMSAGTLYFRLKKAPIPEPTLLSFNKNSSYTFKHTEGKHHV